MILCFSCKKKSAGEGIPVEELIEGLDPGKLNGVLLSKVSDTLYKPKGIYDARFDDTLKKYYIKRDGNHIWLNFLKDSLFRVHLNSVLHSTEAHGLKAKFYNVNSIEIYLKRFDRMKEIKSNDDYLFLSDLDYILSMSIISIYKDLALGRIDPYRFYKPYFNIPLTRAPSFNIFSVLQHQVSFHDSIKVKTPSSVKYNTLQKLYGQYKDYLKNHKVVDYDTSQPVNSQQNITAIDQRMEMLGVIPKDTSLISLKDLIQNRDKYIKNTRQLFGLAPAGGVNTEFIERVCVPASDFVDNAMVSMERERWFSAPDTGNYVLINLTEFMVYMHSDSIKSMKVCLGKSKPLNYDEKFQAYLKTKNPRAKPIDSETPQIGSRIIEVIINPTWTVPNSIIGKEMYHQIVKDPSYLTRKGFEVLLNGKVVSPGSVNWSKYSPYSVPVKIRQKAGPSNSLGKLKFNFPNGHNIYLHDTPEKGKFSLTNRAVSHGCVRLNYPVKMAEFLLGAQGDSGLVDKFRLKMGLQPYDTSLQIADSLLKPIKATEFIKLKKTIPIYFDYRTMMVESDASVRFVKDIYRKNKAIARKLNE